MRSFCSLLVRLAVVAVVSVVVSADGSAEDGPGDAWRPFEAVRRPAVPPVERTGWAGNPIDAFIAHVHGEQGLVPAPVAPRHVLLRRLYLDLTGLPPTRRELHAFLEDPSPDAYARLVDRLLASPRHGERWGRHWMDVWRYSDWAGWGKQVRDSQPHIWRWRDWIVESLNADRGYDRMVLEMLAADEVAPEDPGALRATGFLARNYKRLSREKWMQDTVDYTARAFLGVTIGCARCHDHRHDAISQEEYYRLRAIFEPHSVRIERLPGQPDIEKDGMPRVYDADLDVKTHLFVRGDDRLPDRERPLSPGVPALLGGPELRVEPVDLPLTASVPDRRAFVIEETLAASRRKIEAARAALEKLPGDADGTSLDSLARRLAELDLSAAVASHAALGATLRVERLEEGLAAPGADASRDEAARAASAAQRRLDLVVARRDRLAAEIAVRAAEKKASAARQAAAEAPEDARRKQAAENAAKALGEARTKLAGVEKKLAAATEASRQSPSTEYRRRKLDTYPARSSGRRLAFARWLAHRDNPLTARVAVNQIWLRHFGRGLVPSVADFGKNGQPPSHPDLLDWLAAELMESERGDDRDASRDDPDGAWSMKRIHRLIVTSRTYRASSRSDPTSLARDPDNRYLWRWQPRRLEAECVRDSVLHVAGRLELAMGGPDLDHRQESRILRRSLYFRHAAEKQMPFLKLFDAPSVTECYTRKESIVPQQALALANSELVRAQSRALARRLETETDGDTVPFLRASFEETLSRPPTSRELDACTEFLDGQTRFFFENRGRLGATAGTPLDVERPAADAALRARENLVHVLLNHNDFITLR